MAHGSRRGAARSAAPYTPPVLIRLLLAGAIVSNIAAFLDWRAEWEHSPLSLEDDSPVFRPTADLYVAAGVTALLLLAVLALTVTRRWPAVQARLRFEARPTDDRHLVAFCIFYVPLSASAWMLEWEFSPMIGPAAALAALVWLWTRGAFRSTLRRDWGLAGRPLLREAGWGLAGYACIWSVDRTIWAVWTGSSSGAAWGTVDPWWLPLPFLYGSLVYAPLVEEAFFRGALHRALRRRLPWLGASLVGAVAFASCHWIVSWVAFWQLVFSGLVFCALREWRNSLIAPITLHLALNGIPRLAALLGLPAGLFHA